MGIYDPSEEFGDRGPNWQTNLAELHQRDEAAARGLEPGDTVVAHTADGDFEGIVSEVHDERVHVENWNDSVTVAARHVEPIDHKARGWVE